MKSPSLEPLINASIFDEIEKGTRLFLTNQFIESQELFKNQKDQSVYHLLGYVTTLTIKAAMTLEKPDMLVALEHVKVLLVNIEPYRKQFSLSSSFSNLIKSNAERLREYTMENLHAEMIFTEATLLKAGLTIMTDESIFSLIKGVLAAKEAHSLYTELLRYLIFLRKESKAGKTSALEENVINDGHFVSGIYLGLGGFNLVLSLLPNIVLRLLELIGLPANQAAGLKMLDQGGSFEHAVRGPLCDMASLFFHSVLGALLEIPSCDVEIAIRLLEKNSKIYPNGAFYLFFEGKVHQTKKLIRTSTECFQKTIQAELAWNQLHHLCYWELSWNHVLLCEWNESEKFMEMLYQQSKWSKCYFCYQQAAIALMYLDPTDEIKKQKIAELMKLVPTYEQKIAGVTIPIETFAIHRAKQYLKQGYLAIPALETAYLWGYFKLISEAIPTALEVVEANLQMINGKLEAFSSSKTPENPDQSCFVDDLSVCNLIKGCLLKQQGEVVQAEDVLTNVLKAERTIQRDHYLVPYAQFELGSLFFELGRNQEAKEILKLAVDSKKQYSMELPLHLRVHILTSKLDSNT